MPHYPLLDIQAAVQDADRNLADASDRLDRLCQECDGQYPQDAAQMLANLAAARELLGWVIPPTIQKEMTLEQQRYEEDDAYWSRD